MAGEWAAALGGAGGAAGGIAGAFHSMKVAKHMKRQMKRAVSGYQTGMAPLYEDYLAALRGEWDPATKALWQGRAESIGAQATGARQNYMAALAARGIGGGPVITGERGIAETSAAQRTGAWRDIEIARRQQAEAGISAYQSNLANLQMYGAASFAPVAMAASPAGAMGEIGSSMDNMAMLLALKGVGGTTSTYSSPFAWGYDPEHTMQGAGGYY